MVPKLYKLLEDKYMSEPEIKERVSSGDGIKEFGSVMKWKKKKKKSE